MKNGDKALSDAFKTAARPAPAQVRRRAIEEAMRAYDEEFFARPQGITAEVRLKGRGGLFQTLIKKWKSPMKTIPALAGGASLAAIAVALFASADLLAPVTGPAENNDEKATAVTSPHNQPKKQDSETVADVARPPQPGAGGAQQRLALANKLKQERGMRAQRQYASAPVLPEGLVASSPMPPGEQRVITYKAQGRDRFANKPVNPVRVVARDPVSTFSIDVDTASYAYMRASVKRGVLPAKASVRAEEMINYFSYDYAPPRDRKVPFATHVKITPSPWNAKAKLLRIALKGYQLDAGERPRANLVFLIDTSGSMNAPDKLPLLVNGFRLLLSTLKDDDTVSIVTYAGSAGTVLAPTPAKERAKILASLERLSAGGSTAGGEGIRQAYRLARDSFVKGGVNRVILATDGDFNVGITSLDELKGFVERQRASGITLSVLGFGRGNYNDRLMQALAQNGNGNAAYIDTLGEARKVLVEQAGGTLFTIAGDVKVQVEFNPARVSQYRLIGYETRALKREDFSNDKVDAGDIGAGHTVTAIYEFVETGSGGEWLEPLRYGKKTTVASDGSASEFAFLRLRYKLPGETRSRLIERPIDERDVVKDLAKADDDTRFAIAVAGFAQLLRGGKYTGRFTYDDVERLASGARGQDRFGYRAEFVNLVRLAKSAALLERQRTR